MIFGKPFLPSAHVAEGMKSVRKGYNNVIADKKITDCPFMKYKMIFFQCAYK